MKPPRLAIVTSLCKGMTLYTHIHLRKDKFTANKSVLVAQQISQGMGYLHARGIIHKDLKTKNIFLENGKVVITDFGLFSVTKLCFGNNARGDSLGIPAGWLCYLAPELVRALRPHASLHLPFSKATDVYAFGGGRTDIPAGWLCYLAPELVRALRPHASLHLPFSKATDVYAFGGGRTDIPAGWLCYLAPELVRALRPHASLHLPFSKATDVYAFGGGRTDIPAGWLCYLAPELVRALRPHASLHLPFSKATDVYAFGTVWYELLCGEFPFKGQPPEAIIWQVGRGVKQSLANMQASRDIKSCQKNMQKSKMKVKIIIRLFMSPLLGDRPSLWMERLGHDPSRGPIVDWRIQTTADSGANGFTEELDIISCCWIPPLATLAKQLILNCPFNFIH
ncbi:hypothetical protein evm_015358 [Chilo suppressalis]|nr:hypothetical protein evm_015358 [Chilo suppressalis]